MTPESQRPVVLSDRTGPSLAIALPRNAASVLEYAAEELRTHVHALAGASPALRRDRMAKANVVLGDPDAAVAAGIDVERLQLAPEAFHLEARDGTLYVLGGSGRGVLYGVYDLLESLGVRWYAPDVTHVPRLPRVEVHPTARAGAPAFEYRDVFAWECGDPAWWARNRLNGNYVPLPDYMGGSVTYGMHVHTFYALVPPGEFFATHPEYYSLLDGVRTHETAQLCLSNPDVLRIATERLLQRMAARPDATIWSVSQNDWEGYCQCPACNALAQRYGTQAGVLLHFVNAVAAETSRHFPDKLIDTIAYMYTVDAPRGIVPHPNVRVRLCPIRCCQGHPFGTCDHPESLRALKALQDWSAITKQLYIWHYCTNFSHYPLPMADFDELAGNVDLYRRTGVYGLFMQGMGEDGGGAEAMALRGWVLSKLLWSGGGDVWKLVDEFLPAYYGNAAPQVREYLDRFHQRVREDRSVHPLLYDPPTDKLFDGGIVEECDAVLREGERKASGDARKRVRLLRGGLTYARCYRAAGRFQREGDVLKSEASPEAVRDFDALVRDRKSAGVRRIREANELDVTASQLRNRLADHPLRWIEGEGMRVAVAPDLGGRIVEWWADDRQWLAPPDPANPHLLYPMNEGYAEYAIRGAYSFDGWGVPYRARQRDGKLTLTADLPSGFRMSRTLELRDGALHIASSLLNRGSGPLNIAWACGLHLSAPDAQRIHFRTRGGEDRSYPAPELPDGYYAGTVLEGANVPDGTWTVDLPAHRVVHTFTTDGLGRVVLNRVTGNTAVCLDLRTRTGPVARGEAITMRQTVRVER